MDASAAPATAQRVPPYQPYPVTVDEYVRFRREGFLVVKGLVSRAEVEELNAHTDAIITAITAHVKPVMRTSAGSLTSDLRSESKIRQGLKMKNTTWQIEKITRRARR